MKKHTFLRSQKTPPATAAKTTTAATTMPTTAPVASLFDPPSAAFRFASAASELAAFEAERAAEADASTVTTAVECDVNVAGLAEEVVSGRVGTGQPCLLGMS